MKQLFTFLAIVAAVNLSAQSTIQTDTFSFRQNGENIRFQGVVFRSNADMRNTELFESAFPVIVLPLPVAHQVVKVGNRQSILADSLSRANQYLWHQDTLNAVELAKRNSIIEHQKNFIEFSDQTNKMLNESIQNLNVQLTEARNLAKDAGKNAGGRRIWAMIVGGGIGFGIGALLGIIASK